MALFLKFFLFSVPERAIVLLVVLNIQISYFDRLYALCDHLAEVAPLPDEIMEEIGFGLGGKKTPRPIRVPNLHLTAESELVLFWGVLLN